MYDNHRKEQQNPVKKHRYNNHSAGQQKKTPALLGYPPSCRDCTRQFQLQLPVRRSSAGFGRRSVPSAVGCGYTPAPVACCGCLPVPVARCGYPLAGRLPRLHPTSCSCPSAGRLRESVAGQFRLLPGAAACRLRLYASSSCGCLPAPVVRCGCLPASRLWDSVA